MPIVPIGLSFQNSSIPQSLLHHSLFRFTDAILFPIFLHLPPTSVIYTLSLHDALPILVLTSVTPASSAPVLQTPKATSSTLYFDSLTVNAGNGGFLHCIQMDTSVNAANQVVSVGADIAFDADPKFFACLVRFESS